MLSAIPTFTVGWVSASWATTCSNAVGTCLCALSFKIVLIACIYVFWETMTKYRGFCAGGNGRNLNYARTQASTRGLVLLFRRIFLWFVEEGPAFGPGAAAAPVADDEVKDRKCGKQNQKGRD